jgi:hypothetical protein
MEGSLMIVVHTDIDGVAHTVEMPDPEPQPLDPTGSLAALLVVDGVVSLTDAANAAHVTEQQLIDEAVAWGLGA